MNEYESLGHMSLVNSRAHTSKDQNFTASRRYQAFHPALQQLRVVFDASCKTTNGKSPDIASRGIDPKCLPYCKLWWQGPPRLRLETSSWPKAESSCDEASDEHLKGSSISSSHIKLLHLPFRKPKTAEETVIRWVQDEHGLVRVGREIAKFPASIQFQASYHLPSQHSISELLIMEQHIAHLHAGPTFVPGSRSSTVPLIVGIPEELPSTSNHRSLGVATEHQTGLLKEVSSEFISSLQPQEMAGRTTKLEGR
ncbi:hypothetical protein TNCV_1579111 [Trichonephila clavipes]|nr:hypothetical protein TNCV_1579111 [Trichonephila clavipes]